MGGKSGTMGPPGPASSVVMGIPNSRSLLLGSAYQATDPTKIAIVSFALNSVSSNSLLVSTQASQKGEVYISSTAAGVTGATGARIAVIENTQGGVLVVGLTITQTIGENVTFNLPVGWYFGARQTVGSNLTITSAFDQSVG